jgi:hypothetical protein
MINASLYITNPFSKQEHDNIYHKGGPLFKNKYWDIIIEKDPCLLVLSLRANIRQDHAGVFLEVGLFGRSIYFEFNDVRHWDDKNDKWEDEE